MTDRHKGYVVVLADDIREDDAKATITAMEQIKGVISVEPIVNDVNRQMAYAKARNVLAKRIWVALYSEEE